MKHSIFAAMLMAMLLAFASNAQAELSSKQKAQYNYVMRGLKLSKAEKDKFTPVLEKYYEEVEAVKKSHNTLKKKLKAADEAGKLTPEQCDELFYGKNKAEVDELAVRKKFYEEFKKVLSPQQAYKAIRLCNDKVQ